MNESESPHGDVPYRLMAGLVSGTEIEGLGVLDIGSVITVEQVAAALRITKHSATAGIRTLMTAGVVQNRQRTGAVFQPREQWAWLSPRLLDLLLETEQLGALEMVHEARTGIEPAAARAAASRILPQQYDAMIGLTRKIYTLGYEEAGTFGDNVREFGEVDARYHGLVLRASGNPILGAFEPIIAKLLWRRLIRRGDLDGAEGMRFPEVPRPEAVILHVAQGKAIVQRNPDAAEVFTRALLSEFGPGLASPYLQDGLARAFDDLRWSSVETARYQPLIDKVLLDSRNGRDAHGRSRR